jgi:hypothetical protein
VNLEEAPKIVEWAGRHQVRVALSAYTPVKAGNTAQAYYTERPRA